MVHYDGKTHQTFTDTILLTAAPSSSRHRTNRRHTIDTMMASRRYKTSWSFTICLAILLVIQTQPSLATIPPPSSMTAQVVGDLRIRLSWVAADGWRWVAEISSESPDHAAHIEPCMITSTSIIHTYIHKHTYTFAQMIITKLFAQMPMESSCITLHFPPSFWLRICTCVRI